MVTIVATMAGTVYKVLVQPGQSVNAGEDVMVLESMKMEVPVTAEIGGTVARVVVGEGDFVNEGDVVVEIE